MAKKVSYTSAKEMPLMPISQGSISWNKTGAWRYFDPVHENKQSPCNHACPAGEDIQKYLNFLGKKQYREAYDTIRLTNPFPATCGRVCYHPCEANCNRREMDEAVSIHYLERFIGDWGLKNVKTQPAQIDPAKGEVAVIGAGPAGMSAAWHLANLGYKVTVFEALARAGGMLRVGIPEYRLPRRILDSEIHSILDRGITLKTGVKVGFDLKFDDLYKYRATFIGVGAHKSKPLGIEGENLKGVQSGLEFLQEVNAGKRDRLEGNVAVIGGGNTAIDVARCALRVGAKPTIYYRRSLEEMPAIRDEIEEAIHEGIPIEFLCAPHSIRRMGKSLKLQLQKMALGRKDESGRRVPVAIKGSEFEVAVIRVLSSIGEDPDLSFVPAPLQKERWGINTRGTHQTSVKNVFAAGDCTDDRRAVTDAIGAGRAGAMAIDRYLKGETHFVDSIRQVVSHFDDLKTAYFKSSKSAEKKKIPDDRRVTTFAEVNIGLVEPEAEAEALRCFSCGVCNACDNCWVFCPDIAVVRENGSYKVNYDYCKGCGICVNECPRDAIHFKVKGVTR